MTSYRPAHNFAATVAQHAARAGTGQLETDAERWAWWARGADASLPRDLDFAVADGGGNGVGVCHWTAAHKRG